VLLDRRQPDTAAELIMEYRAVTSAAHANIALAKYWGKLDSGRNLTAVPSLSLTLDGLCTTTTVEFSPALAHDEVSLNGSVASQLAHERVVRVLERVRALSGVSASARVTSRNDFPTASGLASSASGFAALVLAAARAAGLQTSLEGLSELAREASASAARSLFGGFVSLGAGAAQAERVAPVEHWDVVMLVAVTTTAMKSTSSTEGMRLSKESSPYYGSWVDASPRIYAEVRDAVLARDLARLGAAMEQSTLMMHACMFAGRPPLLYWSDASVRVIRTVEHLRARGVPAYFTMDAGPHVKVLTEPAHESAVAEALRQTPGVMSIIRAAPGPDASLVEAP
jgi:diphosphomevalonate decarboxylase